MTLYVTRHGETEFNRQGRFAGTTDVPINDVGILQAQGLAERMRDVAFDCVFVSPLLRARQTADAVMKYHAAPVIVDADFAERNVGAFEGLTWAEIEKAYPDLYAQKITRRIDDAPPGGETIRQFEARVLRGLARVEQGFAGKTALIVAHGFVSRIINKHYQNLSYDEMHTFLLKNCEVVTYTNPNL